MTNATARPPMRLALAGLALLASTGAQAIVGGSGVDSNTADSPWAGVGSLSIGGGTYSGALVSDRYVLTAAHVVSGRRPAASSSTSMSTATSCRPLPPRRYSSTPGIPVPRPVRMASGTMTWPWCAWQRRSRAASAPMLFRVLRLAWATPSPWSATAPAARHRRRDDASEPERQARRTERGEPAVGGRRCHQRSGRSLHVRFRWPERATACGEQAPWARTSRPVSQAVIPARRCS